MIDLSAKGSEVSFSEYFAEELRLFREIVFSDEYVNHHSKVGLHDRMFVDAVEGKDLRESYQPWDILVYVRYVAEASERVFGSLVALRQDPELATGLLRKIYDLPITSATEGQARVTFETTYAQVDDLITKGLLSLDLDGDDE